MTESRCRASSHRARIEASSSRRGGRAFTAAPKAHQAGRASVPERRFRSWPPPKVRAGICTPLRIYRAPAPLGPWILWELTVSRSMPVFPGVKGCLPKACTASTWRRVRYLFRRMTRAAASTGRMLPISLFTAMMLTKAVSGVMASSICWGEMRPKASGARRTISQPSFSSWAMGSSTEGCSIWVVTMRRPTWRRAKAPPKIARLLDSVPPEVKVISSGWAERSFATDCRAWERACSARNPRACRDEGLP